MLDFINGLNVKFKESDKEDCLPLVERMAELSAICRKDGLFALYQAVEKQNDFLKTAITILVEGIYSPEDIEKALQILAPAWSRKSDILLPRVIIAYGVMLMLEYNYHPRKVREGLLNFLGEKYVQMIDDESGTVASISQRVERLLKKMKPKTLSKPKKSDEFDVAFASIHENKVKSVILELCFSDLWIAMKGYGNYETYKRIFENLSARQQTELLNAIEEKNLIRMCDVDEARLRIIDRIKQLEVEL